MVAAAFVASLLAGCGAAAIADGRGNRRRLALAALAIALPVGMAGLPAVCGRLLEPSVAIQGAAAFAATAWPAAMLAALPAGLALLVRRPTGWAAPVLGLLSVLPLLARHADVLWTAAPG